MTKTISNRIQKETCLFCRVSDELDTLIPRWALPSRVNVFKCRRCTLVFLESRTRRDELDSEENTYWDGDKQKEIYLQDGVQQTFVREFRRRLDTLDCLHAEGEKLLDVGCGAGHFLDTARSYGWEVSGLDISGAASEIAQETYGLNVEVGTLEQAPFVPGTFDVITLWDVIEHIRRPLENIQAANRLLRVGGILIIKTPDESSLFKWLARAMYRLLGRRGNFLLKYVYYIPHYFSYSKKTIALLLERGGFEICRYESDETPRDFATEKINVHYKKDSKRILVVKLLPAVQLIARCLKKTNKMVIYARKIREEKISDRTSASTSECAPIAAGMHAGT